MNVQKVHAQKLVNSYINFNHGNQNRNTQRCIIRGRKESTTYYGPCKIFLGDIVLGAGKTPADHNTRV